MGLIVDSANIISSLHKSHVEAIVDSLIESVEEDTERFSVRVLDNKLGELYDVRCNLLDKIAEIEKLHDKVRKLSRLIADGIEKKTGEKITL